ncbi:metal-sensing transcriptional repressor [Succinispira mobilis]|uniref:metal-sensing transcriptional repressor n=1 Tax=Succinispira mobilis TaxID=78120 RepID=UPI00037D3AFB|nr:metal-sensing transcriptional repressor [Succinispira mobilis]
MNLEQKKAVQSLKTARGQIDGIIKMLEEERYCVDISNQIIASQALLKKANLLVLKQHMHHCVKNAFENGAGEEKIEEIIKVLGKIIDK